MAEPVCREEVRRIIREETLTAEDVRKAVKQAVGESLLPLGLDTENPLDTQADMAYVRKLRQGSEALKSKTAFTVVGAVVTAIIGLVVAGFFTSIGNGGTMN